MNQGAIQSVNRLPACLLACAAVVAAAGWAGCSTAVVDHSAADVAMARSESSAGLEFFDELERRPLACQDDLLQGLLMVRQGKAPSDHAGRVAEAVRLGIIDAGYSASPLSKVTVEEASSASVRTIASRDYPKWAGHATGWARAEGLVPEDALPDAALTGAQLLSMLGVVSDMQAARGGPPAEPVAAASSDAFEQFTPVAPAPAKPTEPAAPKPQPVVAEAARPVAIVASDAPKPRPEPLPEMKLVEQPKPPAEPVAVAKPEPSPAPVAKPAAVPPAEVVAAPKAEPAAAAPVVAPIAVPKPRTNPWTSGKPISPPKNP